MGSKALIAILGIAILFVCVVDPSKEKGHASVEDAQSVRDQALVDSLSKVSAGFERVDGTVGSLHVFQEELSKAVIEQGQSLVSIEKRLAEVEKVKLVSSEAKPVEQEPAKVEEPKPVKAEVDSECTCGPECPCRQKAAYPSSGSVSYGSTGSSVKASYGSTGSAVKASGYGSSGSSVSASGYGSSGSVAVSYATQSQPRTRTPVRNVVRAVTAPIANVGHWSHDNEPIDFHLSTDHARELTEMGINIQGMSREQMLTLHDSLHEGQSQPQHTARAPVFDFNPQPVSVPMAAASNGCPYGGRYVNGEWVCNTGPSARSTQQSQQVGWFPGKLLGRRR